MDTLQHFDAISGSVVSNNLRAVRCNPGILAGIPQAHDFAGHPQLHPENENESLPASDASETDNLDNMGMEETDLRSLDVAWPSLQAAILSPTLVTTTKAGFSFASEFALLHERCLLPCPVNSMLRHTGLADKILLDRNFTTLRSDVAAWIRTNGDAMAASHPEPFPGGPARLPADVFERLMQMLDAGVCDHPRTGTNLKQALFLVLFALALHVFWLQH